MPVLRKEGGRARPSPRRPELLTCLDYGVRCTGWLCPHFSLPTLAPEELIEEAIADERDRRERAIAGGEAILLRVLRERRAQREGQDQRGENDSPPL